MSSYTPSTEKDHISAIETGWHYFYAEDKCLNRTDTFSFYYDATAPIGQIISNEKAVPNASYICDNFSFTATDHGSGVDKCFYKTPNTTYFQPCFSGIIITKDSGDGWYEFYSVDRCGNTSEIVSVFLETANPIVSIYRNHQLAYTQTVPASGTYETDLYYNIGDTLKIGCDSPSGNVTSNYSLNADVLLTDSAFPNDTYQITITNALGVASYFNFPIFILSNRSFRHKAIYLTRPHAFL